jgi:Zn-dependent M28 family amino/carboxypeptidase
MYDDIMVVDDRISTVLDDRKDLITQLSGGDNVTVTYFEGLNVLVRIPGTNGVPGAILLSAHIDSVSTAPGATVQLIIEIFLTL